MTQSKHVPQRTCVACGAKKDQAQLIRVSSGPGVGLSIGRPNRDRGRGAYICADKKCWDKALKGTRLEHSLRATLTKEDRAALVQYSSTLEETEANGKIRTEVK